MSQPAEKLTPPAPIPTLQPTLTGARPKVLRRPAALARSTEAAEVLSFAEVKLEYIPLNKASQPGAEQPAKRWQDDVRFGGVLLALVLLANIVAALLLAPAATTLPAESSTHLHAAQGPTPAVNVLDHKAR